MPEDKPSLLYRMIRETVRFFYPKYKLYGLENMPQEPVIVVGNHCQMHGPVCCELYFPGNRYTWCAGEMMHAREVPEYAFNDFWAQKPKWAHWFYRLLSYIIAPLSQCIFNNARTIGVYRDGRILSTFKRTVNCLCEGASVVIFPEHNVPYNHILCDFQDKFIDIARLYYKKTGKELAFVPMYIAPARRAMYLGQPIRFQAGEPMEQQRARICLELKQAITAMAVALPEHRVVPYRPTARRNYPSNHAKESRS